MALKSFVRRLVKGYRKVHGIRPVIKQPTLPVKIEPRVEPVVIPTMVEKLEVPMEVRPVIGPIKIPAEIGKLEVPLEVKVPTEPIAIPSIERIERPRLEEKLPKRIIVEGFEIPKLLPKEVKIGTIGPKEERAKISLSYPLIPRRPAKDEPVFAYAKIFWDQKTNNYVYQIIQPELSEKLEVVLKKVKNLLEQKLDIDFSKLKRLEARDYLNKNVEEILTYFDFRLTSEEKSIIRYYIERDFIGLGKIEPFMRDDDIEDISCDGVGIPIFVFHRNPSLGSVVTNVLFNDSDELDSFIYKLSQLCGKSISVASPLIDGSLPDGSRVQATLATDIARRGSNFTIRKFTEKPLTPIHLLNYNTIDERLLAYLWFIVDYGKSVLVCGGAASGKTTLLNVLSLFIRPEKKIISIEDTPELKLPHPHWVPTVARVPIAREERAIGEVDLFDLLKESIRQRPDYVVVGEVRGKEAFILFQQMAMGHPSLATIHAENISKLMDRLRTPPISLPSGLLGSLDLIVFLLKAKHKDKHVRRVNEVLEIVGLNPKTRMPITNQVFKWNAVNDKFEVTGESVLLKNISEATGLTEKNIKEELERRMFLLSWMKENNIVDYIDVYDVLNMYYHYPERTISYLMR